MGARPDQSVPRPRSRFSRFGWVIDATAGALLSGVGILTGSGLVYGLAAGSLPQTFEGLNRPEIVVVGALLVAVFLGFGLWVLRVAAGEWRSHRE
jgi:hypothetical protein